MDWILVPSRLSDVAAFDGYYSKVAWGNSVSFDERILPLFSSINVHIPCLLQLARD
jgi:hypothetical protein